VERLVAVWCPTLLEEGDRADEAREFTRVLDTLEAFCPWVEAACLGVATLPARGPARFFGGEPALVALLAAAVVEVVGTTEGVRVGVADGLFAALLAARAEVVVPPGTTGAFVAPWSVAVLRRPELAVTLQRLGVHTLGQFAALPGSHVSARFGADAAACHRVARGEEGELAGLRDPGIDRRLRVVRGEVTDGPCQPGFFGGASAADARAARAFARVQHRLGIDAVLVGRLGGGRGPAERARLVPWGSRDTQSSSSAPAGRPGDATGDGGAPWPGRVPSPAPVAVLVDPPGVEVLDASGRPVTVTGRGLLTSTPTRCSVAGGPWQGVAAWAGPWPATERWWSTRRRRARLQIVFEGGMACLLVAEREKWWMEALYD
jgi:protein ImuB